MIYINLYKPNDNTISNKIKFINSEIILFIKNFIKPNYKYKILYHSNHIIENDIQCLLKNPDNIIFWHPNLVYSNLEIVKMFKYSIAILERPTILLQKISENNPVNENSAIFHGFYIFYIYPDNEDITNIDYKIVIDKDRYLMTNEKLLKLLNNKN